MAAKGKISGLRTHLLHDSKQVAKRARDGKRAKLEQEIRLRKPHLSDDELQQEVERAIRHQMAQLSYQRWYGPKSKRPSTRPKGGAS